MLYNLNLENYCDTKSLLLTPNQRIARKLIVQACEAKFRDNNYISTSYNILSYNDFVSNVLNLLLECDYNQNNLYYIDKWQQEIIFKKIIDEYINNSQDNELITNISTESIYKKVIQAWDMSQQWCLDWTKWQDYPQVESKLFYQFAFEYDNYIKKCSYLDYSDSLTFIISLLSQEFIGKLNFTKVELYGFDDISPRQQKLFDKLKEFNIEISEVDFTDSTSSIDFLDQGLNTKIINNLYDLPKIQLLTASNQEQEYLALAKWAKASIDQGLDNIGIIVPNLSTHRKKIIKYFEEIIPDRQDWNISGGENLSDIPVVKSALLLLELIINKKLDIDKLNYLLNSVYYLKYENNVITSNLSINSAIGLFIDKYRSLGYKYIDYSDIKNNLINISNKFIIKLDEIIYKQTCDVKFDNNGSNASHTMGKVLLPSQWALLISSILLELGWPAGSGNNISSLEFQAINQFNQNLEKLNKLDKIHGSISLNKLYKELKSLLNNSQFQIETNNNKIDILGMLEGAGLNYNKLWIFNLTSDVWPSSPQPNPFIPIDIQIKYNLPQSNTDRELAYAKKLTSRYLSSSQDIVLSYTKQDQDKENSLSLLIDKNDLIYTNLSALIQVISQESGHEFIQDNNTIRELKVKDNNGPIITKKHIKSGIRALSLQAECPFRAFAETRLNATNKYNLDIGPAAWMRGQIVHRILELLYKDYNSRSKLATLIHNKEFYNKYLNDLIKNILSQYQLEYKKIFTKGIVSIESELIYKITNDWLSFELNRQDFEVVSIEQEYLIKIENIEFKIRIDRIDKVNSEENKGKDSETSDTTLVIIDYKTSKQNLNNLFSESITNLQLPVYLYMDKFNYIKAVIYGEIIEDDYSLNGISKTKINIDGCQYIENWDELEAKWKTSINKLALDYSLGNALINPLKGEQTCRSCHLDSLCRKDELCQN